MVWRHSEMSMDRGGNSNGGDVPYQTDRLVRNWAETFECRPERFYAPNTEDEVVKV